MGRYSFDLSNFTFDDMVKLGGHLSDRSVRGSTPNSRGMSAYDKQQTIYLLQRYCRPPVPFHWRESDFRELVGDFKAAFDRMVLNARSKSEAR